MYFLISPRNGDSRKCCTQKALMSVIYFNDLYGKARKHQRLSEEKCDSPLKVGKKCMVSL